MSRRRPTIIPHLAETSPKSDKGFYSRRKSLVPSQTTLSVQDVADYSTPAGASMANEEMRRLRIGLANIRKDIEPLKPQEQSNPAIRLPNIPITIKDKLTEDKITKWALTLFNNGVLVNDPMLVQGINFLREKLYYPDMKADIKIPIAFNLTKSFLESKFQTQSDTIKINIVANAITQAWDWYQFSPEAKDSIYITDMLDNEGETEFITGGIFEGYGRRTIALINDEWDPGAMKSYSTNTSGHKAWHDIPLHFRFPVRKFITSVLEKDKCPDKCYVVVGTTLLADALSKEGFPVVKNDILMVYHVPDTDNGYITIKPKVGDVVLNMDLSDIESDDGKKSHLLAYCIENGINEWIKINTNDKNYVHTQTNSLSVWNIKHNLGKYPIADIFDDEWNEVDGRTTHVDENEMNIIFICSFTGIAILN